MAKKQDSGRLGLEFHLQRPADDAAGRIPVTRSDEGAPIYPELDGDGDHVHFEMAPMSGESLLWPNHTTRDAP